MQKVQVELTAKEAEQLADQLVERLDEAAKWRLVQKLQRQTRRRRWEPLVLKMRRRFAQRPLSFREIRKLCEAVRLERFEQEQEG